jgi:hypothetical protein
MLLVSRGSSVLVSRSLWLTNKHNVQPVAGRWVDRDPQQGRLHLQSGTCSLQFRQLQLHPHADHQRGSAGAVGGGALLLEARRWRLQPGQVLRLAAQLNVVNRLHVMFRGDLRGLVKALEDLQLTLRQCNQTELQEQLGETAWDRLLAWAQVDAASVQTQAELVELWQVRQPTVSQTLQPLMEAGAVEALPRRGREAIRYLMTGTARLAL